MALVNYIVGNYSSKKRIMTFNRLERVGGQIWLIVQKTDNDKNGIQVNLKYNNK